MSIEEINNSFEERKAELAKGRGSPYSLVLLAERAHDREGGSNIQSY